MTNFLCKLFNIYPGDERGAFLFACLAFTVSLAATAGLKFSDSAFLLHVGSDYLPLAYGVSAGIMMFLTCAILYAFKSFGAHIVFQSILFFGVIVYAILLQAFYLNIGIDTGSLWFCLRIFAWLLFSFIVSTFWTFVDQYYHLQDAKRLYSLFSSSVFLGVATTGAMLHTGYVEFEWLIFFIVSALIFSVFLSRKIAKTLHLVHDENSLEVGGYQEEHSLRKFFSSIASSRFTLILMCSNFLIYVLLGLTEYNYLASFETIFIGTGQVMETGDEGEAAITLFLGQIVAVVSICNIIFGLFIYSRWVRRFGIGSILPCTPVILLVTFGGWLTTDWLLFPIMGFLVVEGTLYVIDDSNFNLLLNAVPSKIKYQVRIIIESFFEPVGMLISSLLLSIPQLNSKLLGFMLAAILLCIAAALRVNYLQGIYKNLSENAIHFQRSIKGWFLSMTKKEQKAEEYRLFSILKQDTEMNAQNFALEGLLGIEDPAVLKKLLLQADALSDEHKTKFLNLLSQSIFATDASVIEKLRSWQHEPRMTPLKCAVQFYLARFGFLHPEKAMPDLQSSNLTLRGAAIISLKKSLAHIAPQNAAFNRTLAAQQLQKLLDSNEQEEVCMGLTILGIDGSSHDADILMSFLKNPNITIARRAAISIEQIADKSWARQAKVLILNLAWTSDMEYRMACLQALGKIGDSTLVRELITSTLHFRPNERRKTEEVIMSMGLKTVPALLAITKDIALHDRCRVLAGRILGRLALPQLRANLYEIINKEIERAYFYFYYHHMIQKLNPKTDLSMLIDALLTGFRSVLDFIIQLLGVAGELEDCELLAHSLRSPNLKIQSQVVEALERSCEPKIFRVLQPLVADLPKEEKLHAYLKGGRKVLTLPEILDVLSQSSVQLDQIMAATYKHRLNLPNWKETLRKQMSTNEEIFHHFAYELLDT